MLSAVVQDGMPRQQKGKEAVHAEAKAKISDLFVLQR